MMANGTRRRLLMTDAEIEHRIQEAELLVEAGHEDRKNGFMTQDQQMEHSEWVYQVFMAGCPSEAVRAVMEYEVFIITEYWA
jgi:hypothetical protein